MFTGAVDKAVGVLILADGAKVQFDPAPIVGAGWSNGREIGSNAEVRFEIRKAVFDSEGEGEVWSGFQLVPPVADFVDQTLDLDGVAVIEGNSDVRG